MSNFPPLEFGSPQRKNGSISLAELSNDLFEIQARVYLADPSIVCRVLCEFAGSSHQFEAARLGRIAAKGPAECHQDKPVLPSGERRPDPIQITGDLCNGILHEFSSWGLVSEENLCPLTGLFPNLMAGQSHVGPNRPSRMIEVPVPPSKNSLCTRHHCTINSRRNMIHDEMLKITSRARRRCLLRR